MGHEDEDDRIMKDDIRDLFKHFKFEILFSKTRDGSREARGIYDHDIRNIIYDFFYFEIRTIFERFIFKLFTCLR